MNLARQHWDRVYRERTPEETSWHQGYPAWSLALIEATGEPHDAPLIDIGCGDARLLEVLAARGYGRLDGLDLSPVVLARARLELGDAAERITWHQESVLDFRPARRYQVWHDRAVFHFLVDDSARARYLEVLEHGLAEGGHLLMATFASDGPRQCSGLPTRGYDAPTLCGLLGDGYRLLDMAHETHRTPGGVEQRFAWFRFRRRGPGDP